MQVKYEQQMRDGLTLLNSFTYGHALDNAGAALESSTPAPQDIRNLAGDYGNSDYNQPLYNVTSLVYDLPFGQNRRFLNTGGLLNQLLGQWQIAAINSAASGYQFNLTDTPPAAIQVGASSLPSYRGGTIYRPNRIANAPLTTLNKSKSTGTSLQYVNTAVLQVPNSGNPFGNLARNAGRTPAINFLNIALNKRFTTPVERLNVEFRGELYNLLNHTNFATPGTGLAAGAGGGSPAGGALSSTLDPRIVQFGVKLLW